VKDVAGPVLVEYADSGLFLALELYHLVIVIHSALCHFIFGGGHVKVVVEVARIRRHPLEPPAHAILKRFNLRLRRPRDRDECYVVVSEVNVLEEPAVSDSSSNRQQLVSEQKHAEPSIEEPPFWPSFWKTLGRNLILPVVGCGVIAVVYMIAASKAKSDPPAIVSATPTPETPTPSP
jgi:hypothetical protein